MASAAMRSSWRSQARRQRRRTPACRRASRAACVESRSSHSAAAAWTSWRRSSRRNSKTSAQRGPARPDSSRGHPTARTPTSCSRTTSRMAPTIDGRCRRVARGFFASYGARERTSPTLDPPTSNPRAARRVCRSTNRASPSLCPTPSRLRSRRKKKVRTKEEKHRPRSPPFRIHIRRPTRKSEKRAQRRPNKVHMLSDITAQLICGIDQKANFVVDFRRCPERQQVHFSSGASRIVADGGRRFRPVRDANAGLSEPLHAKA
mmetsp:Transcript_30580/g.98557  ORF Transcript_30580/g.98557 Transcript_30580/m.98557 type:complete len:262 (+) Transcript_30580:155-940(+)